jgi:hypothetical protein
VKVVPTSLLATFHPIVRAASLGNWKLGVGSCHELVFNSSAAM